MFQTVISQLLSQINLANLGSGTAQISQVLHNPQGLFVMLAVVVVILYGLSIGKTKALVSLLSVFVAYLLTVLFPFLDWLTNHVNLPASLPTMVVVFAGLYVATFFLLSSSMIGGRLTLGEISLTKVVLISIVQLGLISSIVITLAPVEFARATFGPAYPYLAGSRTLWIWAAASVAIMPFMRQD